MQTFDARFDQTQTDERGTTVTVSAIAPTLRLPSAGTLLIAAETPHAPTNHFTGKIEEPALLAGTIATWPNALDRAPLPIVALWDFGLAIDSQTIVDIGHQNRHGALVNAPTSAVAAAELPARIKAPSSCGVIQR